MNHICSDIFDQIPPQRQYELRGHQPVKKRYHVMRGLCRGADTWKKMLKLGAERSGHETVWELSTEVLEHEFEFLTIA